MSLEHPSKDSSSDDLSLLPPPNHGNRALLTAGSDSMSVGRGGMAAALPGAIRGSRRPRLPIVFASLLVLAGVLLLVDAGVTLVWQEPISALYAKLKQESLNGDLSALEHERLAPRTEHTLDRLHEERRRIAYLAGALERRSKAGSAVGRIHIPTIGASFVVVKGTGTSELENGPGIYSATTFPGIPGTTAIAGHRTTYLAPFRHIDKLRRGQQIVLDMPYARLTYRVIGSRVVLPTDVSVIKPVGYTRLVLSACTPLFSASHRLIVFARLTTTTPLGAARLPTVHPGASVLSEPGDLPTMLKTNQRLLPPLMP